MNTGTPGWLLLLLKRNLNKGSLSLLYLNSLRRELTDVCFFAVIFFSLTYFFEVVIGGSNVDFIATAEKIIVSAVLFYLCILMLRTFLTSFSYL